MIATSMISVLFGIVLSLRFNVVVLIPAFLMVSVLSLGALVTHPQAAWWILGLTVSAAICLQCGYFAGMFIRRFLLATPSPETSSLGGAQTPTRQAAR
jgi:CDP-diglyceride synthetase